MSLVTVYFVELCLTEDGLLPTAPNCFCPYEPEPFETTFCGDDELNIILFCVVEIVKVEGFEIATGLLLDIFIY